MDTSRRRLQWIPLEKISPLLLELLLLAEDKRFYSHSGVDYYALAAGFSSFLTFSRKKRGASTITMQVAALLNSSLRGGKTGRSIVKKLRQIRLAWQIEKKWSKRGILEAYLNLVSYRGELLGIDSASRGLFQKAPHSLSFQESLLLVSLLPNPQANARRVARRGCYLAKKKKSRITCSQLGKYFKDTLAKKYFIPFRNHLAFHAAQLLTGKKNKKQIYHTSIDADIQTYAIQTLRQHLLQIQEQNVHDGAVLIVDNRSGEILAYVGSSGNLSKSAQIDAIRARRQAGSTLKPFLYALAMQENVLQEGSYLDDSPVEIQVGTGIYKPGNYQNVFHGKVRMEQALASSLNVPAVKVLSMIGERKFTIFLRKLGFSINRSYEYYGLSMALGSLDVTLAELVAAYRTLALRGKFSTISLHRSSTTVAKTTAKILDTRVAASIGNILANRENRMLTFGLESPLSTRYWSAVKTGTSKDMRDNWCVGFTKEFTVGVWVGNFSGQPMWNVSGVSGAAPVWIDLMNWLSSKRSKIQLPSETSRKPLVKVTEPVSLLHKKKKIQGILRPTNGTIIAIDPDIPEAQQRVFFQAKRQSVDYDWFLNGKRMAHAGQTYLWQPTKGVFLLKLVDRNSGYAEAVRFEVR